MSKTHRLVMVAILSALSFILMFFSFSIIPGASFLKIEFSIIPVLLGLVLIDLKHAYLILILRSLLKLILNNSGINDFIGLPMNIIALATFVTLFALVWKPQKNRGQFVFAGVLGTLSLTLVMVLLNYFYAVPLYAKFANFDISAYIGLTKYMVSMVIPFNLVEGLAFALSFYFIYFACRPIIERYTI
ncbi:ECF transporter S component [Streptococcus iniae]|uniref:ECF transporter S component n=1 Tax=Streptococcus iniae TaxID=1346 RepID=UPI0008DABDBC|nr:ECF transporter S component [Streptococcus iniae]OHX27566.1 ECF transporter S component [Streptococcus iniae]RLV27367.1 ECF transporter S component [Streptococcus iniae]